MLNYRHTLTTLNSELKKANRTETAEYAYSEAGNTVYRMTEPGAENCRVECGIYYSKSDLVEQVNEMIE